MCNFETTLNIHPPLVVSVAVLIIDIHESRTGFIHVKSLQVMYYRPFDRPFGLGIRVWPVDCLFSGFCHFELVTLLFYKY